MLDLIHTQYIKTMDMKRLEVVRRSCAMAGREATTDEPGRSTESAEVGDQLFAQLRLFGSVSKPCTPGEHQNSW